jgi:hypothetical protein
MTIDKRKDHQDNSEAADFFASETQARIAAAWAELVEAAKSDPKARAFLDAFGPGSPEPVGGETAK